MAKAASVGLFGVFSQKVKHQFHCNSCGYEW
nr:MAG TPA: PhnA Zinc-Ribbon [Caudoviricetes sp.]